MQYAVCTSIRILYSSVHRTIFFMATGSPSRFLAPPDGPSYGSFWLMASFVAPSNTGCYEVLGSLCARLLRFTPFLVTELCSSFKVMAALCFPSQVSSLFTPRVLKHDLFWPVPGWFDIAPFYRFQPITRPALCIGTSQHLDTCFFQINY